MFRVRPRFYDYRFSEKFSKSIFSWPIDNFDCQYRQFLERFGLSNRGDSEKIPKLHLEFFTEHFYRGLLNLKQDFISNPSVVGNFQNLRFLSHVSFKSLGMIATKIFESRIVQISGDDSNDSSYVSINRRTKKLCANMAVKARVDCNCFVYYACFQYLLSCVYCILDVCFSKSEHIMFFVRIVYLMRFQQEYLLFFVFASQFCDFKL